MQDKYKCKYYWNYINSTVLDVAKRGGGGGAFPFMQSNNDSFFETKMV